MIEFKVNRCHVGQYNLCSNEKQLLFVASLQEDDKVLERDGIKAQLYYMGDPDDYDDFQYAIKNDQIDDLFEQCYQYAKSTWSTTDYKKQCLTFAYYYQLHWEEIDQNFVNKRKKELQEKLEEIQKQLSYNTYLPSLNYSVKRLLDSQIKDYQNRIKYNKERLEQLKEGTEDYIIYSNNISTISKQIQELEEYLKNLPVVEV